MASGLRRCVSCEFRRTPQGKERQEQARQRAADEHDGRLERIAAIEDRVERLISAVRFVLHDLEGLHPYEYVSDGPGPRRWDLAARSDRMRDELARTCPEFFADAEASAFSGTNYNWVGAWDSREIGTWFANRKTSMGFKAGYSFKEQAERKWPWGTPRRWTHVATHWGWTIKDGLTSHLVILTDGRVIHHPNGPFKVGPIETTQLQLRHLDEIAGVFDLPDGVEIAKSYTI
jgi:hypothetical protein